MNNRLVSTQSYQHAAIMEMIPQKNPFRFVDEILEINENGVVGTYQFKENEYFYKGHFPENPVTPGVILTEAMAQIGLLAYGLHLYAENGHLIRSKEDLNVFLTSTEVRFKRAVFPNEKIWVKSEKVFFKHNVIKCKVKVYNKLNEVVCQGTLSGMFSVNYQK